MKRLSVAEASKKLGECVERVYCQQETFELVKNGVPLAHLVPINGNGCTPHELAADLAKADLPEADRRALRSAIRKGRKHFKPLKNPWA
jgi:antitoxin (DNA-binding transcriptional repressor) of toxin-antitoxin stability system